MPDPLVPRPNSSAESTALLRDLLRRGQPQFWDVLAERVRASVDFTEVMTLANLRRKAKRSGVAGEMREPLRLAMLAGSNLYPLQELVEQFVGAMGGGGWNEVVLYAGAYDSYGFEMLERDGDLDRFEPEVVVLIPADQRCRYEGKLTDSQELEQKAAVDLAEDLLGLCRAVHERTGAEVILTNFLPVVRSDPGSFRTRSMGSAWTFRKVVNLELGLRAPNFVHLCDVEFLATRRGAANCVDLRRWFESKQIYAPEFAVEVAREIAHLIGALHTTPKKVLALDLDETLWGGVLGEEGLEGIELGTMTPRGEAFRAFQESILELSKRGVLLAVCSKNDPALAMEPFTDHPEMVLRASDIASFQAGWGPKPESLLRIAEELGVGIDSVVFVDDSPAEIELVRQTLPEVETLLLSGDPAEYVSLLQSTRFFEPRSITQDDLDRCRQYQQQAKRASNEVSTIDMETYLASLAIQCAFCGFVPADVPRIAQLINKSNQFNLTTRRRTEAGVNAVMVDPDGVTLSVRLADRFGDSGLISAVILKIEGTTAVIDTWVMSCRVLKREVECEVLNELVRRVRAKGCDRIVGTYWETPRNAMVRGLLPRLGFEPTATTADTATFELRLAGFVEHATSIQVSQRELRTVTR